MFRFIKSFLFGSETLVTKRRPLFTRFAERESRYSSIEATDPLREETKDTSTSKIESPNTSAAPDLTNEKHGGKSSFPPKKEVDKSYKISFKSAGVHDEIPSDKTVLNCGLDLGVKLKSSCREGSCGACRIKMVSGKVTYPGPNTLTEKEEREGYVLACVALPVSDLIFEE